MRPQNTISEEERLAYQAMINAERELCFAMAAVTQAGDRLQTSIDNLHGALDTFLVPEMNRITGQFAHADRYYKPHVWNQGNMRLKDVNRTKMLVSGEGVGALRTALADMDARQKAFEDARTAWIDLMERDRKDLPYQPFPTTEPARA